KINEKSRLIFRQIFLNGIFLYFAFTIFAQHLLLDNVMRFLGVQPNISGAFVLSVLSIFQIGIFYVDIFFLKESMVYILSIYPIFILGVLSVITRKGAQFLASPQEIVGLLIFNLIISIILFTLKLSITISYTIFKRRSHAYFL
ncbi:hypothetical protein MXB_3720, partial [Myxobolus squamalis]